MKISEIDFHSIVDSLDEIVVSVDSELRITYHNESFREKLPEKIRQTEISGASLSRVFPGISDGEIDEIKQVFLVKEMGEVNLFAKTEKKPVFRKIPIVEKDRVERVILIGSYAAPDQKPPGIKPDLGNELKLKKLEKVGILSRIIAHSFNNILFGITGYIDLLKLVSRQDNQLSKYTNSIEKAVNQLTQLINQLQSYAKEEKSNPVMISINEILSEMIFHFKREIPDSIQTIFSPDEHIPDIFAVKSQICEAIYAVLQNAGESIEGEGKITVTTEKVRTEKINHLDIKTENCVCVTIADTGLGMDEETLSKIFVPFFSTKYPQRGIGLTLAYAIIVRYHEGGIDVTSKPEKGTVFRIYLPLQNSGLE